MKNQTSLARRAYFSCGHRYFNPNFSEEKNQQVFGACYSEHGHGHNYILEAYFSGEISPTTGMIINLSDVDSILHKVTSQLDHKFLNEDLEIFKTKVPTTENLAQFCYQEILKNLPKNNASLHKVRLYENEDLWVDYSQKPDLESP